MAKEIFPEMSEEQAKALFVEIDLSKSNEISFAEFDTWVSNIGGIEKIMAHPGTNKNDASSNGQANDEKNRSDK